MASKELEKKNTVKESIKIGDPYVLKVARQIYGISWGVAYVGSERFT